MRQFWNPQSPNLASRLRVYQGLFSNTRIEFTRITVSRLEVTGDKAVSHLTTDERHLDKKTGAILWFWRDVGEVVDEGEKISMNENNSRCSHSAED
jgi:hypothetical protein